MKARPQKGHVISISGNGLTVNRAVSPARPTVTEKWAPFRGPVSPGCGRNKALPICPAHAQNVIDLAFLSALSYKCETISVAFITLPLFQNDLKKTPRVHFLREKRLINIFDLPILFVCLHLSLSLEPAYWHLHANVKGKEIWMIFAALLKIIFGERG